MQFCEVSPRTGNTTGTEKSVTTGAGITTGVQLAMKYILGIHHEGTFWGNYAGNFQYRTKLAANQTAEKFGQIPDMIVFSSGHWVSGRVRHPLQGLHADPNSTLRLLHHYPAL